MLLPDNLQTQRYYKFANAKKPIHAKPGNNGNPFYWQRCFQLLPL